MDNETLTNMGSRIALTVLVGKAIALAARDHDDPRGALREVMTALEDDIAAAIDVAGQKLARQDREVFANAAQTTTLDAARLADSFLTAMGAPPAT